MRRLMSLLAVAGMILATAVFWSGSAAAQPARAVKAAPACPHASQYPPTPNAMVESSATVVTVGQHIKVSGTHYCPNESVDLTIHGQDVGTGHTDGNGSFDPTVTVPAPAGSVLLCGVGASGLSADRDCIRLNARAAGGASASAPGGTGGSGNGTAFTGTDLATLIAGACALLAIGVAFATAGRRQKAARS